MPFKLSMLLSADAKGAQKELASTKKAVKETGDAAKQFGKKARVASAGTKSLASSADRATAEVQALAAAEQRAAQTALNLGKSNKLAAGQVGNLTAQFNDIGVMMAAGQNPLQLAMQQGTQITQVIGPMGAAGAVKALGAAFMQMINPVTLITIGTIAAGAAMFNWLRSAGPAVVTFEDAMSELTSGIDSYSKAVKLAGQSTDELEGTFGSAAGMAAIYLQDLKGAEFRQRQKEIANVFSSLLEDAELKMPRFDQADLYNLADVFDLSVWERENRRLINSVLSDFADFSRSSTGSLDDQIAAIGALITSYESAASASGGLSEAEDANLKTLKQISLDLFKLQELKAGGTTGEDAKKLKSARDLLDTLEQEVALNAVIVAHGKTSAEVFNHRLGLERARYALKVAELPLAKEIMAAWDHANPSRDPQAERLENFHRILAATRAQAALSQTAADQMLANLRQEEAVRIAILVHGKDSVQVTDLRWAAEERVLNAQLDAANIAGTNRAEIVASARAAYDAETATNAWADAMAGVRSEVDAILSGIANLGSGLIGNAAKQVEIDALRAGKTVREAARAATAFKRDVDFDGQAAGASWFDRTFTIPAKRGLAEYGDLLDETLDAERAAARKRNQTKGGGGSAKQQDALAKLISKEREELAILRVVDPLQKELIKNREALAGATGVERDMVTALIAARIRETAQMEALQDSYDTFGSTALSSLDDLIVQGKDLDDVLAGLARSLASAALQATVLGTGPLAGLFGTAGGGGLFGSLWKTIFRAEGGPVTGEGGPTEDKVMMFASPGEYVVKAAQASRHRSLLDAINSGAIDALPAFAAGGAIGPVTAAPSFLAHNTNARPATFDQTPQKVVVELHLSDDLDARIDDQSQGVALRVMKDGIEEFSNVGLTYRVKQIVSDERAVG